MRRWLPWILTLVLALAPLAWPGSRPEGSLARAQDTEVQVQEDDPDAADEAMEGEEDDGGIDIDALLEAEMEVLAGRGGTYDSGDRRDPFRSLLARDRPGEEGDRPEGIPGLVVEELTLTGIFTTPQGPVAQVRSAEDRKSYLLRVGDELFDGDVVSIKGNTLVLRQFVSDPRSPKPFQDIVMELNPSGETERGP